MKPESNVDAEIQALNIAIDAFNRVDYEAAQRMLIYLENRFLSKERLKPELRKSAIPTTQGQADENSN